MLIDNFVLINDKNKILIFKGSLILPEHKHQYCEITVYI